MRNRGLVVVLVLLALIVGGLAFGGYLVRPGGAAPGVPEGAAPGGPVPEGAVPEGATAATIEYVHDGDTLFLTDGTKVRLLGIDTPEVGEHRECYGDEARELLRDLLPEGTHVQVLADVQPLDQYGRSLLFVYTDDGVNVSLELIERGAAEAVVLPPNVLFADELEAAEDRAQAAGLGMWGAC
ncbi:MAG: thermonuclease family protein [Microbacteriaceae bacterium]